MKIETRWSTERWQWNGMARAQLSSQSMGVLRFGPCDGALTLPSGPVTGSRSGRETLVSAAVAPGGGSSPPLRPQPAKPSAATTALIAAIRDVRRMKDKKLNSDAPMRGTISGAGGNNVTKPPHPRTCGVGALRGFSPSCRW